ncbi:phosphoprotein [Sosuga virus]|uniref:Phosphoprotein n=1 Tax=Sosuga virus TaxID=1452514 RepID=W5S6S8_9MONO|nr:phosphoprotein [Sosuga virus]AHH02037.1 phosphoprotein [Sosuga virus]AVT50847.1 P [Expression vector pSOSV_FL-vc] [Expression vector pSOSV_FL-vc]AVT50853.1 P [Expression vector pSOSV/ZsG-FL] [Expression vector pSOSV/ZsG-FL]
MDQPPSDAEISAWIERGLATARHFAPGPVTSQSSLGKSTIKKGNTKQLVDSAEFTAATLAPAGGLQGSMPCSIPAGQSKAGQGARPKVKKAAQTRATPTKPDAPTIEPVYEDIVSTPGRDKAQVQLPSPKLSAKDKLLSAPPLQQHSNIPTGPEGQNFKRGGCPQEAPPLLEETPIQDTDESSILYGEEDHSQCESGAIQPAVQSHQSPGDITADVVSALESANSVKEIIRYLKVMENKMNQLEWKIDKVLAQNNIIQQIRNEQMVLKAGMATLEGLITTIKIMDPGVGTGADAAQAKRAFKDVPVVVSGPVIGENDLIFESKLEVGNLGRPQKVNPTPRRRGVPTESELASYKLTLAKLLKDCIPNNTAQSKFLDAIEKIKTEADFKALKREIVRAAV